MFHSRNGFFYELGGLMFHSRNGFFFERVDDGAVRIRLAQPVIGLDGTPSEHHYLGIISQVTLPENEWASVLASVSGAGETSETWQAARDYHATGGVSNQDRDPASGSDDA